MSIGLNDILRRDQYYDIELNTGREFIYVRFLGLRQIGGKQVLAFETTDEELLTVNPSYHTCTLTHKIAPKTEMEVSHGNSNAEQA